MIEDQVQSTLFTTCQGHPGQTIVVGFSGGADSLCLLHLLAAFPIKVIAAHYDHGLRSESSAEAVHCQEIAKGLGVQFASGSGDVRRFAAECGLSIEEAARIMRYRFLFDTAGSLNADAVATAHHADDQVETILMHLLRGAGPDGLSGMNYRSSDPLGESEIPLIRPLLGIWREQIMKYCEEHQLDPLQDATNQESTYFRNRIRLELIPELETYNRQVRQHLWQTAAIVADENQGLSVLTREAVSAVITRRGESWIELDQGEFSRQPLWLQRRIFRKVLFEFRKTLRDFDFSQVERALSYLNHPEAGKTCQINADMELFATNRTRMVLAKKHALLVELWPQIDFASQIIHDRQAEINLPGGWALRMKTGEVHRPFIQDEDPWKATLDADALSGTLSLGKRQKGELFEPFGMAGEKIKVGDFFTNVHLPSRARDHWPLLRSGDQIAWIPGFRLADFCKVTAETKQVLQLELMQK